jgi:hypothetical protein
MAQPAHAADPEPAPIRISDALKLRAPPYCRNTLYARIKDGSLRAWRDHGFWWIDPVSLKNLMDGGDAK